MIKKSLTRIRKKSSPKRTLPLTEDSQKLQAAKYFVLGAAQELKYPLMSVLNRTTDLLRRYKDRDFEYIGSKEFRNIMRTMENIQDQIQYCYDTADRIINLNKKQVRSKKIHCHVNSIIRDVIRLKNHHMVVSDIKCKLKLARNLPSIAMGEIEFNQVVNTVVNNAVEAMNRGGLFTIKTIHLKQEHQIQVEIKDDGVGIPADNLKHIFDPLFTTKQRGVQKNSGLGLAIVYSLIKVCHGKIKIESSLRKGTTVRIFLPIAQNTGTVRPS